MIIEIYESVLNKVIEFIKNSKFKKQDVIFGAFKELIKEKIQELIFEKDIYECKRIVKYYGTIFNALKQVEDINNVLDNNELGFFRDLANLVIFKNCFDGVDNIVKAWNYILDNVDFENSDDENNDNNNDDDDDDDNCCNDNCCNNDDEEINNILN